MPVPARESEATAVDSYADYHHPDYQGRLHGPTVDVWEQVAMPVEHAYRPEYSQVYTRDAHGRPSFGKTTNPAIRWVFEVEAERLLDQRITEMENRLGVTLTRPEPGLMPYDELRAIANLDDADPDGTLDQLTALRFGVVRDELLGQSQGTGERYAKAIGPQFVSQSWLIPPVGYRYAKPTSTPDGNAYTFRCQLCQNRATITHTQLTGLLTKAHDAGIKQLPIKYLK